MVNDPYEEIVLDGLICPDGGIHVTGTNLVFS